MAEIPDQKIKAMNIFGIMILTLESRVVEQGCPLHIRHHIPVIHKLDQSGVGHFAAVHVQ
jgi:hypothetical protein